MSRGFKILLVTVFFIATAGLLTTYYIKIQENTFADEIISKSAANFETSFKNILKDTQSTIGKFNETIGSENLLIDQSLNETLSVLINSQDYLSGIAISAGEFSYMIYRENSTWAVTFDTVLNDSTSNWYRLNRNLEVVSEWTDVYKAFPSVNNLDNIKNQLAESKYIWVSGVNSLPESLQYTGIVFKVATHGYGELIAGLIYDTPKFTRRFSSVLRFNNPLVTLITENNRSFSPIITSDTNTIKRYNELNTVVGELISKWSAINTGESRSYSFEKFNAAFWSRIVSMDPTIGLKGFAITISANDLAITERKQEQIYLYAAMVTGIITLLFLMILIIPSRKKKNPLFEKPELEKSEILKLIKKGETEFIEFKSSLRWDYREEKVNKVLENVILKSINAFANAKGGNLFIGVNDEMEILGLENDFSTLKGQDADYFELHLRKLIVNQYGIGFTNDSLKVNFQEFNGKIICIIRIKPSDTPLFLKTKNKQGAEVEKFYVRSGNASQEISSLTEINRYIKRRFRD